MTPRPFFWIFLGAALSVFGDVMLKRWSLGKASIFWGMAAYLTDALVWAKILKDGSPLSSSVVVWETLVVLLAIGWVVWREGETMNLTTGLGALIALAGVALMEHGQ